MRPTDAGGICETATVSQGVYQASYTPNGGTCGAIANPHDVALSSDVTVQNLPNARISNESALHGCTLQLLQVIESQGGSTRIEGPRLAFKSDHELSGTVTITMLDAMGQTSCQGTYDADFTKKTP